MIDWLRERGFEVKGHTMHWGFRELKDWGIKKEEAWLRSPEARQSVLDHIRDIGSANRGKLSTWDVVNEHFIYHDSTDYHGRDFAVEWFKAAHEATGGARLFWNETGMLNHAPGWDLITAFVEDWVRYLQKNGAPIHGIGDQSHFDIATKPTPEQALSKLDRLAKLGLDIEITEYDCEPWDVNDPEQTAILADYLRDYMTACFSHPAVTAFMTWTPAYPSWMPNTALTDERLELRPHGKQWRELVTKIWHTSVQGKTNADGELKTRGFLGDYEIVVKHGEERKTVKASIPKQGETVKVTFP
jgi:GH35 family endo-1,4-beta-xylanase